MTIAIQPAFPGLLGFGFPGGYEWIILLILGLLIFGRRLPEVGRSLGKSIVEFKKGIKNIEDEIETESSSAKIAAAPNPELPRTTPPAEPRVSHEPDQVEQPATGGSDTDRTSG
ncbi:MAG: twin-arginine translocase TatA/TatE family subunit [Planctomycetota bacterium]|nr:MAG: twin-arginine translocase TatA/TatE family subunit [Planctomycetota bacterium]